MINKGQGCLTAIFKGLIPISTVKQGLETVFQKPSEPIEPTNYNYVTDGLIAWFTGEDGYIDGAWVDRISGYKFKPVSGSTAPVHDSVNKLYEATKLGGMISDWQIPSDGPHTFEVVTRDIKNMGRASTNNYGVLVGGDMSGYSMVTDTIAIIKLANSGTDANIINVTRLGNTEPIYKIDPATLEDKSLDTFSYTRTALYHNAVKKDSMPTTTNKRYVGLFTHKGTAASSYRGTGKIHAVRVYNRNLTAEEIAQNRAEDIRLYGN